MNPFEEASDDEDEIMQNGIGGMENFGGLKNTMPMPMSNTTTNNDSTGIIPPSHTAFSRGPFSEVTMNGRTRSPTSPGPPLQRLYADIPGIKEAAKAAAQVSQNQPFEEDSDSEDAMQDDLLPPLGVSSTKRPLETDSEQLLPRKRVNVTPPPPWTGAEEQVERIQIDSAAPRPQQTASTSVQTEPVAPKRKVVGSIKIRLSDGREFDTPQFETRARQKLRNDAFKQHLRTSTVGQSSFYGIDIHRLMRDAQAELALGKTTAAAAEKDEVSVAPIDGKKTLLWTEKYRAKRFAELVGDERTHRQVMRWLKSWDPIVFPSGKQFQQKPEEQEVKKKKILLITGPPGLGKTTLAHVAAKQAGYEPAEINASEARNKDVVNGRIRDMISNEGVKMGTKKGAARPVCLIVDEIDGVEGNAESGFTGALVNLLALDEQNSRPRNPTSGAKKKNKKKDEFRLWRPIIAVCNDLYAPSLKALRPLCEIVYMNKPPINLISNRMKWVFQQEKIEAEDGAVRRLVELACGGEGGKGGGSGGDMRGALIGAEWITSRLRNMKISPDGQKAKLTRKLVEQEMGGGYGGVDGGGNGKGGVRDVVEKVFMAEKTKSSRKEIIKKGWMMEDLRRSVETCGEFDKVMSDCYATYPERAYHDDNFLTKPCAAYEWLHFYDNMSSRVWNNQDYELTGYLTQPILAFRHLFASSSQHSNMISFGGSKYKQDDMDEVEAPPTPFTGVKADFDAREALKGNKTLIQSLHSNLLSVRTLLCFKSEVAVATELAPYLTRILSPQVVPVVVTTATGRVASVRKESEKTLINRSVGVMLSLGLEFEKVQIESGTNRPEFAYRLEPPIDTLANFPTFDASAETNPQPVRYAVRQVLHQECEKEKILQQQLLRQARGFATSADMPQTKQASARVTEMLVEKEAGIKRDFFGRVVKPTEASAVKGKKKVVKEENTVWVTFNEGFSNAVRKNIGLEELMRGFF